MRRRRAALTPATITASSQQISRHVWHLPALSRCERIACYLAVGGEVDCAPIMAEALARGRRIYLPVVHGRSLLFAPWDPAGALVATASGYRSRLPGQVPACAASQLDVVLTPLVAFDDSGHRLGMGGGFYDRTFAFTGARKLWRRPRIIGLAYEFQRVETLRRKAGMWRYTL